MKKILTAYFIFFISMPLFGFGIKKKALESPNIIWILSEDNSPYFGVYGNKTVKTPNIDKLAETGIVYDNAFSNAPVCAPSRNTLITGMYSNSLGTHQMRSNYKLPEFVKFFPEYLREAGYYTTNCFKEDYNTSTKRSSFAWNESSKTATYKNRNPNQPFFHIQNIGATHETSLFDSIPDELLGYNPNDMEVYPYHPNTTIFRHNYAQYYYRITNLDKQIGVFIDKLKKEGLFENTIIFYFSDHGGVLPRGKRFLFESGTKVPLVVHVPEKYKYLFPEKAGSRSDRMVSFVDFAPSILNMVGQKIPSYMQGQPFIGQNIPTSKEYVFMFRGRMDERTDLMHAARNKQYRYIRNYYPERIYGQYLDYLWKNKAVGEWERLFLDGKLNNEQSAFWKSKPYEELYDIVKDPHNVKNLALDANYSQILSQMSKATNQWINQIIPVDILPEIMLYEIDKKEPIYNYLKNNAALITNIHNVARLSSRALENDFDQLYKLTKDKNTTIAFWAIKSMFQYKSKINTKGLLADFKKNLSHPDLLIQNLTADVLTSYGDKQHFDAIILKGINSANAIQRSAALQLYAKIPRNEAIDKRIKERYEVEKLDGLVNERNVYNKLYDINIVLDRKNKESN